MEEQPFDFEALVKGIEEQINSERLEQKGAFGVATARVCGLVYLEAVAAGVPPELAKDMAADVWIGIMGSPTSSTTTPQTEG